MPRWHLLKSNDDALSAGVVVKQSTEAEGIAGLRLSQWAECVYCDVCLDWRIGGPHTLLSVYVCWFWGEGWGVKAESADTVSGSIVFSFLLCCLNDWGNEREV